MSGVLGTRDMASLLGVTSRQMHAWSSRRTRGFPDPIACVLVPQYPGDKKRAPLWDIDAVVDWFSKDVSRHG